MSAGEVARFLIIAGVERGPPAEEVKGTDWDVTSVGMLEDSAVLSSPWLGTIDESSVETLGGGGVGIPPWLISLEAKVVKGRLWDGVSDEISEDCESIVLSWLASLVAVKGGPSVEKADDGDVLNPP